MEVEELEQKPGLTSVPERPLQHHHTLRIKQAQVLPIHVGPPRYGANPHPPVMTIVFSPKGDFRVAGDNDGSLLVFDVVTRKSVRRLSAESITISGINSVSVSSDGLTLAVATSQFDSFGLESGATLFWSFPQGLSLTTDPTCFQFKDWGEGAVYSVTASSSSLACAPQYYAMRRGMA
jgi:WD40 repeat protein